MLRQIVLGHEVRLCQQLYMELRVFAGNVRNVNAGQCGRLWEETRLIMRFMWRRRIVTIATKWLSPPRFFIMLTTNQETTGAKASA